MRSGAVDMIVVDSVAALTPRAEIEGEIGSVLGAHLRSLKSVVGASHCRCDVIILLSNWPR